MRPMILLWLPATNRQCDYLGHMTNNRWRSIGAHFEDGAGRVSQSILPIKTANNSFMTTCYISAVWFPGCRTNNCWHSIDTHFQYEVGRVSLWFLPMMAANTLIMYNHDQINFELPDLHDLEVLTLCWWSFCHECMHIMQSFDSA